MANTPVRHIRIPDDIWNAARVAAESDGTTVAAVVVAYLRGYTARKGTR